VGKQASKQASKVESRRLTWVAGKRSMETLDETSKKILKGGRKNLTWQGGATEFDHYRVKEGTRQETNASGTSIFDPVVCELIYRWFCPPKGKVLDPFAGGSVRGIVAAKLGYDYTGIELLAHQLAANELQAKEICKNSQKPRWILGDALRTAALAPGQYDLIFSCPPYGDLEVYSDDPRDLSTMPHNEFLAAYRQVVACCAMMLKPNRFACFVVGDFRDRAGFYRNFVSETIAAFGESGLKLYNEAILVTAVGSLPIRVGIQFGKYRKLGKTHQNCLVFYNGDPKAIVNEFPEIQVEEIEVGA